jgi:hypothetical protein
MKKLFITAGLLITMLTFAQAPVPPGLSTRDTQTIVYPNPSEGQMRIELKDKSLNDLKVKVYDMNAKLIVTTFIHKNGLDHFDFEAELQAGVYILQIITKDEVVNRKIIIK